MAGTQEREQVILRDGAEPPKGPQNAKERIYEKLRMPLWLLDTIIALLVVALVAFIIVGYAKGRGMA